MHKTAFYFAYTETISRYRRSILGPLWLVFGTSIGVLGLGFVWSTIFGLEKKIYVPMLCIGLIVWQFLSNSLIESSSNFTKNSETLLNIKTPNWFFTIQLIIKGGINFLHSLVIAVVVLIIYPPEFQLEIWKSLIGLLLLFLNLLWICHVISYLGARYRDTEPLISNVMPLIFFFTPVIYRSQNFDGLSYLISLNPLSHIIDAIREPMLGHYLGIMSYIYIFIVTILGWVIALLITGYSHRKLAYWL